MMNLISAPHLFWCLFLTPFVRGAEWFDPLFTAEGLDLGDGIKLHLQKTNENGSDLFERHSLRADYAGLGITVGKAPRKEAVQVGFSVSRKGAEEEGRKAKGGGSSMAMSMVLGYKLATMAALGFSAMGALVLKAIGLAKLALIISGILFASKILHRPKGHHHATPEYVEVEALPGQHSPLEYLPPSGIDYHPSGSSSYYTLGNFNNPSTTAERTNYGALDQSSPSIGNNSSAVEGNQQVAAITAATSPAIKRHDFARPKPKLPTMTVQRITVVNS